MEIFDLITENIVSVIVRIDNESKVPNISAEEFVKCGNAMTRLLNKVENDFDLMFMCKVIIRATDKLKHTPGPLNTSIIKKLISKGFILHDVTRVATYSKSHNN